MPANLTAEAEEALEEYRKAKSITEKIKALKKALALIPKHKGTENLRAQLKRRLAELRETCERKSKKGGFDKYNVKKEGVAQVAIIGYPNVGKSSLLKALTNVDVKIAEYPFTTTKPEIGMLNYGGAKIQIVELPAFQEGFAERKGLLAKYISVIRNCDLLLVLLDPWEAEKQEKIIREELRIARIKLNKKRPEVYVEKTVCGGIEIVGKEKLKCKIEDVIQLLNSKKIFNAYIKVMEGATLEDIEEILDRGVCYKKAIFVTNKADILERKDYLSVSAVTLKGLENVRREIWKKLDLVRVYLKPKNKVEDKPIVLRKGSIVEDLAEKLRIKAKHAKIWRENKVFKVGLNFALRDGDIVRLKV